MIYRYKILISVVQELGSELCPDRLQLLLFLFCHEFSDNNYYYDFIATKDGPLSLQVNEDKKYLINKKYLENSNDWVSAENAKRFATDLDMFEKIFLQKMKNRLQELSVEELQKRTRENFSAYFSDNNQAQDLSPAFYTIGYEGKTPEAYLNALSGENVALLCDVRKNAYSQKLGFSKKELQSALAQVGIKYMHMPELGIISEKRQNLTSKPAYDELFDEYERTTIKQQQNKLNELIELLAKHGRIAITCFEKEMHCCHRSRIVKALKQRTDFNCPVRHL